MRSNLVLQARLAASSVGLLLVTAATPLGAQDSQEGSENLALAESVVAREEAASEREFEPVFRAKARELLAALPLAELLAQTGDGGLGLNSLGDSQADLVYTPLTPCRIVDTRLAGGILAANTTRSFLVTGTNYTAQGGSATGCGVPYGPTTAAVINFVAVTPAGQGSLWVTPFGTPMPNASIINYTAGVNIANGLSVAICNPSSATCTQDITIRANNSAAHLVADVQGYFQRVTTGGVGTALLADSAVTAPKISSGVVVRSLNAQTDAVALTGTNGLSVSQGSGTVTVSSNATATNTAGAIVARDASGNFSAGTITGSLNGNATTATAFSGSLAGEVTGMQAATVVSNAVATNSANAIVRRDASGDFSARRVTLQLLSLAQTSSSSLGVLTIGGGPFLHQFGNQNTFVGASAGNFTLTGQGNSAFGNGALYSNTTGGSNLAAGYDALIMNTTGSYNAASGTFALMYNTSGNNGSALGYQALQSNTTGNDNSALGYQALRANTTGATNAAFGSRSLAANTTATGNSAFGYAALAANTTGGSNSAFGRAALTAATTGWYNSAFGDQTLEANTTGMTNSAFGYEALTSNTTGAANTAFGTSALASNTTANQNSALGFRALNANTTGYNNSAIGFQALQANTTGEENTAVGHEALYANTVGRGNSAFGRNALRVNTWGESNAAFGGFALANLASGQYNTACGHGALYQLSAGTGNVAVGFYAGYGITSGDFNITIGTETGASTEYGTIRIGDSHQTATYIGGIYSRTSSSGLAVYANSSGKLGTTTSSRRYKERIADMDTESDVLWKLRPVSFYYRPELDEAHLRQYGLVAEEVAEVAPDLVAYDEGGTPQAVRYHFVNAMLLNEVQKQRRLVEEERRENEEQRATITRLEARLAKLEATRGDQ